jgi:hypothetical protein
MFRNTIRRNPLMVLRSRGLATPSPIPPKQGPAATPGQTPSKQSPPGAPSGAQVQKGGGSVFPFLLTICLAGLGYASYKAESDGAFEAQVKKVPGAIYILSPFRKAISGLVTKPPQHTAPRENDKKEEMEPVSVTPPTATIDSDVQPAVDPYAEIDAEVKAELNVSAHDDQSESATAPHPLASADHPEQKPDRQETDIHDATVSSSASSSSGAHAPVASAHVTERQD